MSKRRKRSMAFAGVLAGGWLVQPGAAQASAPPQTDYQTHVVSFRTTSGTDVACTIDVRSTYYSVGGDGFSSTVVADEDPLCQGARVSVTVRYIDESGQRETVSASGTDDVSLGVRDLPDANQGQSPSEADYVAHHIVEFVACVCDPFAFTTRPK